MRPGDDYPCGPHCICDWPETCGGLGTLDCEGCGGDQCVCVCGGEDACPGCDECEEFCEFIDAEDLDLGGEG